MSDLHAADDSAGDPGTSEEPTAPLEPGNWLLDDFMQARALAQHVNIMAQLDAFAAAHGVANADAPDANGIRFRWSMADDDPLASPARPAIAAPPRTPEPKSVAPDAVSPAVPQESVAAAAPQSVAESNPTSPDAAPTAVPPSLQQTVAPGAAPDPEGESWLLAGVHGVLTAGSFLPSIVGSGSAALDAGVYAGQGDWKNAGISIAAAGAGILSDAGAAKVIGLGVKAGVDAAQDARAYSVFFHTTVKEAGAGTRASHFAQANDALAAEIQGSSEFASAARDLGISVPANRGTSPAGWTWHHAVDQPGVMQLVPRAQHQGAAWQHLLHPGGVGGFSVWGNRY